MKEIPEEELFDEFLRVFTREEAYRRIKEKLKPKVTEAFVEKLIEEINETVTPAGISFAEIIKFAYRKAGVVVED